MPGSDRGLSAAKSAMAKSSPPPDSLLAALPSELSRGLFAKAHTVSLAAGLCFRRLMRAMAAIGSTRACSRRASQNREAENVSWRYSGLAPSLASCP